MGAPAYNHQAIFFADSERLRFESSGSNSGTAASFQDDIVQEPSGTRNTLRLGFTDGSALASSAIGARRYWPILYRPTNVVNNTEDFGELWVRRQFRWSSTQTFAGAGPRNRFLRLLSSTGTIVCFLELAGSNRMRVTEQGGGTNKTATGNALAEDTNYEVCLYYKAASGAGNNGIIKVFYRVEGGAWVELTELEYTNHNTTTLAGRIQLDGTQAAGTVDGASDLYNYCAFANWSVGTWADFDITDTWDISQFYAIEPRDVDQTNANIFVNLHPGQYDIGETNLAVTVEYATNTMFTDSTTTSLVQLTAANVYQAFVPITGLTAGTRYYYRVHVYDAAGVSEYAFTEANGNPFQFKTLPSVATTLKFGLMSCHDQNGHSHPYDVYTLLQSAGADWIFHLGDYNYMDEQQSGVYNAGTFAGIAENWQRTLCDRAKYLVTRGIPVFLAKDDHDVWENEYQLSYQTTSGSAPVNTWVGLSPNTRHAFFAQGMDFWKRWASDGMLNIGAAGTTISITGAGFTDATNAVTGTGLFSSYTFVGGHTFKLTAGTGCTPGYYRVASKQSNNEIRLGSADEPNGGGGDIADASVAGQLINYTTRRDYRHFETADTLILILDTRTDNNLSTQMIDTAQLSWIQTKLAATTKKWLLLFSPSAWGDVQDNTDNWNQVAPAQRTTIEGYITASAIRRAFIFTGDRHCNVIHTRFSSSTKIKAEILAGPARNDTYSNYDPADETLGGVLYSSPGETAAGVKITTPRYGASTAYCEFDEITGQLDVSILNGDGGATLRAETFTFDDGGFRSRARPYARHAR